VTYPLRLPDILSSVDIRGQFLPYVAGVSEEGHGCLDLTFTPKRLVVFHIVSQISFMYKLYFFICVHNFWGTRWRIWVRHCATSREVAGSVPDWVIGIFSLKWSFRPHYGLGFDSASNRNEYQEYFLGSKGGRCTGLTTLPLTCAHCLEIWDCQPRGIPRAFKGTALRFYILTWGREYRT